MLLDFIFLAIILILVALGIYKGLTGMFFGIFSIILSLIISFFLADVVAQQIFQTPIGESLQKKIEVKCEKLGPAFNYPIVTNDKGEYIVQTDEGDIPLKEAFNKSGAVSGIIANLVTKQLPNWKIENMSITSKFAPFITKIILSMISGFILFIISTIVMRILYKVSESWEENIVFFKVNKVLGLVLCATIGVLLVNFLMLGALEAPHVSFFSKLEKMQESGFLSKLFYKHNFLKPILNSMNVNTTELFTRIFPVKG